MAAMKFWNIFMVEGIGSDFSPFLLKTPVSSHKHRTVIITVQAVEAGEMSFPSPIQTRFFSNSSQNTLFAIISGESTESFYFSIPCALWSTDSLLIKYYEPVERAQRELSFTHFRPSCPNS